MGSLIETIETSAVDTNKLKRGEKKKTSFWASETEAMAFDIYHKWIETPETNPMEGETLMMLTMRKMSEEAVVKLLDNAKILLKRFANEERVYFEWGPHKVPISGYPDAGVAIDGSEAIVEIKTYYGQHNHVEVTAGRVRPSYLKQLAIYLYHFKIPHGILLMINQGTGEMTEFDLYQDPENPYHFACPDNEIEINLEETFKRWEKIYVENILPRVEPAIEKIYKYDIRKLDWSKVSTSDISKARNGHKVLGDWEIKYSGYKDLIVERQGTTLGYTNEEIDYIRKVTDGYSRRASGMVKFVEEPESEPVSPMPAKPIIKLK